jgi:hypothetical protein
LIPELRRVRTEDSDLRQFQDGVVASVAAIRDREVLDGRLIKGIDLVSGTVKVIDHGLGRKLLGWIPVRQDANATVWESDSESLGARVLKLNASANVTIDLWVF